jgi:hypothetical protein
MSILQGADTSRIGIVNDDDPHDSARRGRLKLEDWLQEGHVNAVAGDYDVKSQLLLDRGSQRGGREPGFDMGARLLKNFKGPIDGTLFCVSSFAATAQVVADSRGKHDRTTPAAIQLVQVRIPILVDEAVRYDIAIKYVEVPPM